LRAYVIAVTFLLVLLGGTGLYLQQRFSAFAAADFTPPPATVAAAQARSAPWRETIEAIGTVRAARGILLSAETAGDVTALHVRSGDDVQAGQLLLSIDERVEVATRQRILARLELAELLYERDASLIRQKSIPQTQFDQSRADLAAARAELAEIDAILRNKRVTAPFAGRLGILQVRLGDYVAAGTPLATLQDLSALEVDFSLPDRHAPRLRAGLTLSLHTAAFPERTFRATLQALDARVDEETRNLNLRAVIEDGEGLLPGMFARLTLDLGSAPQRVLVPETAVTYSLQGDTVYVIERDDQGLLVEPRVVNSAGVRDGQVAITRGLEAGEQVVTAGQNKLYRGARVQIDDSVVF
jgi:membrane fusion protein (multidrug efflux system)